MTCRRSWFTSRDSERSTARDNLIQILTEQSLDARTVLGMGERASRRDATVKASQKVVCFTETPLEHVWMLCRDIELRSVRMQPYGIAFTKAWARRNGVNPVLYLDITVGHNWLTRPVEEMVTRAMSTPVPVDEPIFRLTPFFEQMGSPAGTRKEFWWEREWRHVGALPFGLRKLVAAFVPEDDHDEFRDDLDTSYKDEGLDRSRLPTLRLLDPTWGLERMIAALAGK